MVNNYDWDESELLYRRLGIAEIPDKQFAKFLESYVHPLVTPDVARINKLIALFNDDEKRWLRHAAISPATFRAAYF